MPAASSTADFTAVADALRALLAPYVARLRVTADGPGGYTLQTSRPAPRWGKVLEFAGVRVGRSYVSYYLFPVYMHPPLLDGVSPALRARMQGKSCFNFRAVDAALLDELAALTAAGFRWYEAEGYV
jgi:hypothetical protein